MIPWTSPACATGRDGARRLGRIGAHEAVTKITREVQLGNSGRPLADLERMDDDEVDAWLLTDCNDAQHGAGGCCMGLFEVADGKSVVDPACRVRGIDALRVIDASVMPMDCQANTNFTTMMIAEKMADELARVRR